MILRLAFSVFLINFVNSGGPHFSLPPSVWRSFTVQNSNPVPTCESCPLTSSEDCLCSENSTMVTFNTKGKLKHCCQEIIEETAEDNSVEQSNCLICPAATFDMNCICVNKTIKTSLNLENSSFCCLLGIDAASQSTTPLIVPEQTFITITPAFNPQEAILQDAPTIVTGPTIIQDPVVFQEPTIIPELAIALEPTVFQDPLTTVAPFEITEILTTLEILSTPDMLTTTETEMITFPLVETTIVPIIETTIAPLVETKVAPLLVTEAATTMAEIIPTTEILTTTLAPTTDLLTTTTPPPVTTVASTTTTFAPNPEPEGPKRK